MSRKTKYLLYFCFLYFCQEGIAQQHLQISNILVEGNKRTKDRIVKKELSFKEGDTIMIQDIPKFLEINESRLKSIGLFNTVKINLKNTTTTETDILVEVNENWYLFPVPIFELADRNFNVWWQEQDRALNRINFGMRLRHYNFTGNKDPIKFVFQAGYTRKLESTYSFPYLFDKNNKGLAFSIFYADNKEIPYITQENKSIFYKDDDERIMLKRFRTSINFRLRPEVTKHHSISLEFHRNWVNEIVISPELNPAYFLDGKQSIKFFLLSYDVQYDTRDNYLYPTKGLRLFSNFKKEGLGLFREQNALIITGGMDYFYPMNRTRSLGTRVVGKTNLIRKQQSFANNTGLGWSADLVSGYQLFVMDGIDHILVKNHIKQLIFDHDFNLASWLPAQIKKLNVQLHLRFNFDFAYVNEPTYTENNPLNNRWIYGYGPALDLIIYNSYLFTFEYSVTGTGERGIFFNNTNSF